MIREERINNIEVKPRVRNVELDASQIKGGNYIPNYRPLVLLCAKRNSGKTTVLADCVENTCGKKTTVWICSPTAESDPTMIDMISALRKKKVTVNVFHSLRDGKMDVLREIVTKLMEKDEDEDVPLPQQLQAQSASNIFDRRDIAKVEPVPQKAKITEIKKKEKKEYKPKKRAPDHIFVIDDLSSSLRYSAGLSELCKNGRHLNAAVYISFQYKNDLPPGLWSQCQFFFVFRHFDREKLEDIYKSLGIHGITPEQFYELYEYATLNEKDEKKRPFLYIDVEKNQYRKSFNKKLVFD